MRSKLSERSSLLLRRQNQYSQGENKKTGMLLARNSRLHCSLALMRSHKRPTEEVDAECSRTTPPNCSLLSPAVLSRVLCTADDAPLPSIHKLRKDPCFPGECTSDSHWPPICFLPTTTSRTAARLPFPGRIRNRVMSKTSRTDCSHHASRATRQSASSGWRRCKARHLTLRPALMRQMPRRRHTVSTLSLQLLTALSYENTARRASLSLGVSCIINWKRFFSITQAAQPDVEGRN